MAYSTLTLPAGTIKRAHVNQHILRANKTNGTDDPIFTVKNRGRTYIARKVVFHDQTELVYQPETPLSCGAVAWMETTGAVTLIDEIEDPNERTTENHPG